MYPLVILLSSSAGTGASEKDVPGISNKLKNNLKTPSVFQTVAHVSAKTTLNLSE